MKIKLLVAAAATVFASSAMAVGAFDGINAQLGIGMGSNSNQLTSSSYASGGGYSGSNSSSNSSAGSPTVFGTAAIGYSFGFANKFNLAANVFYMGGNDSAGNSNATAGNSRSEAGSESTSIKMKDTFGVSIEPGYYFANQTLGYLKLGWAQTKVSLNSNSYDSTNNPPASSFNGSANTQGALYGLGFKQMITSNVYLGVEAYQIQYANKSFSGTSRDGAVVSNFTVTAKPTQSFGGVVLGYKF
jgi:hypothetical protein